MAKRVSKQNADDAAGKGDDADIIQSFRQAIWDAAGKLGNDKEAEDKRAAGVEVMPDNLVWKYDKVLTFKDFCESPEHMGFPPLSERQLMVADYMFGDEPKRIFHNNRNLAVLMWGKGSLRPSSEIITADGLRMTVEECANRNLPVRVWSRDQDTGHAVVVTSTPAIKKDEKENCFRVATSFGHISEASEDHKYFTASGWRKLKDIAVGDWILGGKAVRPDNIYNESNELCRWTGYIIGDGCLSSDHHIQFFCSTPKPDIIADYCHLVESFGGDPRVAQHNTPASRVVTATFRDGDGTGQSRACNPLNAHAKRLGIYGKTAGDKRIPVQIMFSSEPSRRSFLESLYATDGWISRHAKGSSVWEIGYISKSRKLIEDLDFMLRGFGISGKIRPKYAMYKGERREYWQLIICHRGEQRKFSALFNIPGKMESQAAMSVDLATSTTERGFSCPPELTGMCAGAISEMTGRSWSQLRGRAKAGQSYSLETVASVPGMETLVNDDVIWEQVLSIEPLGFSDVYTFTVPGTENYLQGGLFHHNSGKDTISVLMICYVVYVLLCLKNPQQFLGLPDHDNIDIYNVAASKEQAQTVFFQNMKSRLMHWAWLRGQWDIQMSGRFFSTTQRDDVDSSENRITITSDAIIFPNNIRAFSGSCEAETLEGKNLLMFVLDEVDAFKQESQGRSAEKIYRTLRTSAVSRFGMKFKGFMLSYPRSNNGFISKMYESTKKFLNIYGDVAFTWQVKPRALFSQQTFEFEGIQIPMDFYEEFRLDPIGAKRAYLCQPPTAETPFMEDWDGIEAAVPRDKTPLFEFRDIIEDGLFRKKMTKTPYMADRSVQYVLMADLGQIKDSASLTLMHRELDKIYVDFTTAWVPDKEKGIKVDLVNMEEIILSIREYVTVDGFYADQWQSRLMIAKMRQLGVKSDIVTLDFSDYKTFKTLLYSGNIKLIRHARLLDEIKNLQLYNGRKVDHAPGCFVGSTRIPLLDGSIPMIEELVDREVWVYSSDVDGNIVPGKASGIFSKMTSDFVDVVLDSGAVDRCTPEHLWMLRDGTYRMAKDLRPGIDRLMPIRRQHRALDGYEDISNKNAERKRTHHVVSEFFNGPRQAGNVVHHANGIKTDNRPDNLVVESLSEHSSHHTANQHKNEDFVNKLRDGRNVFNLSETGRRVHSNAMSKMLSSKDHAWHLARARKHSRFRSDIDMTMLEKAKNEHAPASRAAAARIFGCSWNVVQRVLRENGFDSWSEFMRSETGHNHKVLAVIPVVLSEPIKVYDLQVDHWHNFALSSGVFVHNSHNDMAVTVVMGTKVLTTLGKNGNSSNMAAEGQYVGSSSAGGGNLNEMETPPGTDDDDGFCGDTHITIEGHVF